MAASEGLSLPFIGIGSIQEFVRLWPIFYAWALAGVVIACVAFVLEPHLNRAWKGALAVLLLAVACAALSTVLWVAVNVLGITPETSQYLSSPLPSWTDFFYTLWMSLFHGGLFIVACMLLMRAERNRQLLGTAQIARNRTEALLEAVQLDALREKVDPVFLLRAMAAVQARYATNPAGADRLLDQLVAFLRMAMPGVRSGGSNLQVEVELARSYALLSASIESGRAAWQVDVSAALPDMPFPSLLLLPLMDQLAEPHRSGRMAVVNTHGLVTITLEAAPAQRSTDVPHHLLYRLRVALRSTFGDACTLDIEPRSVNRGSVLRLQIAARVGASSMPCVDPTARAPPRAVTATPAPGDAPDFTTLPTGARA